MYFIMAVSVFTLTDACLSVYLLQAGSHYVVCAGLTLECWVLVFPIMSSSHAYLFLVNFGFSLSSFPSSYLKGGSADEP